jgi:cytochrome P450
VDRSSAAGAGVSTNSQSAPAPVFDLFSDEFAYRRAAIANELRTSYPVHWHENHGFWTVTRYADIQHVCRRSAGFLNVGQSAFWDEPGTFNYEVHMHRLASMDAPAHTALRRLVSRAFTPRALEVLEGQISITAHKILDAFETKLRSGAPVDLVQDFAYQLPVLAVNLILRVPDDVLDFLNEYKTGATDNMKVYFSALVEQRRRDMGDDLISEMIRSADAGNEFLTPEDVHYSVTAFWTAANLTTTNLFSHSLVRLQEMPEVTEELRQDPSRMPGFIEEVLRMDSPVTATFKSAGDDVALGGQQIRAGDRIWLLYAAANRDPEEFDDPDTFDLRRAPNKHLAFAYGPHACLGAPLARMEARIGLLALLGRRLPMHLDLEHATRIHGRNQYGYRSVPTVLAGAGEGL